jgi:hypothetical protein
MADKKQDFLPFHAINEFMRDDYRLVVVRAVLHATSQLPPEYREAIEKQTKRSVKVPGFRNSALAPAGVRVAPTASAFEKYPDMVGSILAAWSEIHAGLRQQVFDLLTERGWELLPVGVNRAKLPGFLTHWPKGEEFEIISKAFVEKYPQETVGADDICLMTVWLGDRLPYKVEGEDDAPETPSAAPETTSAAPETASTEPETASQAAVTASTGEAS